MPQDQRVARRLKVRDLHTLQVVVATGSMARAATELGTSQSAISKSLAELEHLVGAALLERSSRGVTPTEAGHILIARGRVIFDEIKQGLEDVAHLSDPASGLVRIGTTEPMTIVVADIVDRLSRRHPRIGYAVEVSDTTTIVRALRERSLDIVITRWVSGVAADDLRAEVLFETPLAVMAARRHPLARRKNLELADLMEASWTLSPPDSFLGRIVGDVFRHRNLALPRSTLTTLSIYMRLNLLATGRFLSILPATMLRHRTNSPWLTDLGIDLSESAGPIAAIVLDTRRESGALASFLETARAVARDREPNRPVSAPHS